MSNQDYYGEKGPQQPPQSYQQGPPQQGGFQQQQQQQQPYYVQQGQGGGQRGGGACNGCPSAGGFFGNCLSMVCAMVCANEIMGAIGQC